MCICSLFPSLGPAYVTLTVMLIFLELISFLPKNVPIT